MTCRQLDQWTHGPTIVLTHRVPGPSGSRRVVLVDDRGIPLGWVSPHAVAWSLEATSHALFAERLRGRLRIEATART